MAAPEEPFVFNEEEKPEIPPQNLPRWRLLVVDDENEVHLITKMVLNDFHFEGRSLEFLHAYSAAEAKQVLTDTTDIAVILLDVVMETDDSGLELVKWIRSELNNSLVRIILRTGQPGAAPEKQVIVDYEINDYKAKTELTSIKLFTAVTTAIRAYRDLKTIRRSKDGFHKIINASSELFSARALNHFIEGVLTQLTSLLYFDEESLYIQSESLALKSTLNEYWIIAGTGSFKALAGANLNQLDDGQLRLAIQEVIKKQTSIFCGNYYVGFFPQNDGSDHILVLKTSEPIKSVDQEIIQVFSTNVSVALENVSLNQKIESTQKEIIFTLGEVLESRSKETGHHVRRVAAYAYYLAIAAGLAENEAQLIRLACPMHDVGKIGINDAILTKPGPLTRDELTEMRKHTTIGYEILRYGGSGLLQMAATIARSHHERWDGLGYPDGLIGDAIPISGRITSIADVFDALSHQRVYKKAWDVEEAFQYIAENSGTLFDPHLSEKFLTIREQVMGIFEKYSD